MIFAEEIHAFISDLPAVGCRVDYAAASVTRSLSDEEFSAYYIETYGKPLSLPLALRANAAELRIMAGY